MRVERSILICFVARSGSWFLSGLLASSGVLGRPKEFFWAPDDGVADPALEDVLREGTTPNGVFGCKFQLGQWKELLARARRAAPDGSDRELVKRMFPSPLYVWLQREDVVAQAVSWSRALQTGLWSAKDEGSGQPRYDRAEIAGLIELIGWETEDWRAWFEAEGIEPVVVTYERLRDDARTEVGRIAGAAGVEVLAGIDLTPYPGWRRQADAINEEWIRRFRAEMP